MLNYSTKRLGVLTALMFCWFIGTSSAWADSPDTDNRTCSICHATPGLKMQLASGEIISAQVSPEVFNGSVHASRLQCTACHTNLQGYPHPAMDVVRPSVRDIPFLIRSYTTCGTCHEKEYTDYLASTHARALVDGKSDSAVCTDCHGVHDIGPAKVSEVGLVLGPAVYSCGKCHKEEFEQYQASVHGKELLADGDVNAPACVDCHGTHGMNKAKDAAGFRKQSLAMCGSCHADEKLMAKYGLSTRIMQTYVSDFHGTSAQLFKVGTSQAPDQAMCYDCHGTHDIQSTVAANGFALQENLLKACQKCHTDAGANYPAAWLGHYEPNLERSPLVFAVRWIYIVLIVGTVLVLLSHIALDIGRIFLNTLRRGYHSND